MRIYNPALGRFLSVDPLTSKYPMLTPYQFASNRPIDGIDLDGLEYLKYSDALTYFCNGKVLINFANTSWQFNQQVDFINGGYRPNPSGQKIGVLSNFTLHTKYENLKYNPSYKESQGEFTDMPNVGLASGHSQTDRFVKFYGESGVYEQIRQGNKMSTSFAVAKGNALCVIMDQMEFNYQVQVVDDIISIDYQTRISDMILEQIYNSMDLIKPKYRNTMDISNIADVMLRGAEPTNWELYETGRIIFNKYNGVNRMERISNYNNNENVDITPKAIPLKNDNTLVK